VKRFESILCIAVSLLLMNLTAAAASNPTTVPPGDILRHMEQVDVSLLTCGPGSEVWSQYGHTAIRINDRTTGIDLSANYGMFSFSQKHFILRFIFGLTDYQMGLMSTQDFLSEYREEGRWVKEQQLQLTPMEKWHIIQALNKNYLPENRTYRYNYFYDNCTTRARDILLDNLGSSDQPIIPDISKSYPSYRELLHQCTVNHRWNRFGEDLLLGIKADLPLHYNQNEFLPEQLSKDFGHTYRYKNGKKQSFISKSSYLIAPGASIIPAKGFTPKLAFILFALVLIALSTLEYFKKRNFWGIDLFLLLATGLPGIILFLMIFSQHPTVSLNFQILILNPLTLFFAYPLIKNERKGILNPFWRIWTFFLIFGIIGGVFQTYAEGITILAWCLLLRCVFKMTLLHDKQKNKKGNQTE
jgi:hypothetical protein